MVKSQTPTSKYKRILLKLSGESFKGDQDYGIDQRAVSYISGEIKKVVQLGVEVGVVVGGGNIWRGSEASVEGMERAVADYVGMLATVMNSMILQSTLENSVNVDTRVLSAIDIRQISETYIRRRAIRHLEKGRVVIFAAGIGNPYMTTDTASALRAIEIDSQVLIMAKYNVDGVYSSDPNKNPDAKKLSHISYMEALNDGLNIMDSTALSLCMENKLPILVFDLFVENSLLKLVCGEDVGSMVGSI
ncbi:MAG: UMP kinase [Chloroflexi bacterium]|nr:UMP kinase [Chloroflexota bacterium]MCH2308113.1 UMP kinase [SAR202 cluster bacterium]MQG05617.1 UMP kinase [SAR202 cluster bacterium]|tara:strand:- start:5785 stop:6525 length:741 start_codon:yes stop_codon:yes gene_type:complete